jgi:hypothetical protein
MTLTGTEEVSGRSFERWMSGIKAPAEIKLQELFFEMGMKKAFPDLSPSYRRSITTTLSFLDETICDFEELAKGRETHSVLYTECNGLSPEQCQVLLSEVAEIRSILAEVKEALGLKANVRSTARFIWSQCSALWASLSEVDSERLKGYGEAPHGFARYWDPKLLELEQHLNRILENLRKV